VLFQGLKRTELENKQLPPFNIDINNGWSFTFTPPYVFVAWRLIKNGISFVLTYRIGKYDNMAMVTGTPPSEFPALHNILFFLPFLLGVACVHIQRSSA
jgi:hypothetical protein